ncbi:ABC transporter substrate-binding protein [Halonatronum saccharophilum]|uniref:ABC transporter substrate-binding protein n=1 Tax=Halonatronum saccharophilum TaxID=150060 RepID=UPI000488FD33|nr:ABC transporter substrate-binding protein [Halonatronum saccharophilum]
MKKVITFISIFLLGLILIGCSSEEASQDGEKRIGVIQIVEHPALDAAREGFMDVLEEQGYKDGEGVTYNYQNAQGDMSTAQTIANQFANDNLDMILAIATPTSQAVANNINETPILITAVTDPKSAGLVDSLDKPGSNLTGTSDLTPVKEQLELIQRIKPDVQRVGILYNAGESNSVVQVDLAQKAADELGLELVKATVSSSNEVYQSAQSLDGRVDAIYIPTDNTVISAIQSVVSVANESNIPLVVGEDNAVEEGALATVGINYYQLGRQTAKMAIEVFEGADTAQMPIQYLENTDLVINLKAAQAMGIELDEELIKEAKRVIE